MLEIVEHEVVVFWKRDMKKKEEERKKAEEKKKRDALKKCN
jgi:hypothetical protein